LVLGIDLLSGYVQVFKRHYKGQHTEYPKEQKPSFKKQEYQE